MIAAASALATAGWWVGAGAAVLGVLLFAHAMRPGARIRRPTLWLALPAVALATAADTREVRVTRTASSAAAAAALVATTLTWTSVARARVRRA